MAVKTSTFTGWKISGKDTEAFLKQINEGQPNALAQESLSRGRALCQQIEKTGYTPVQPKKITILNGS